MGSVASARTAYATQVVLVAVAALISGCGAGTYQQRLEESQKYFAYVEKIDANLAPSLQKSGPIEELRVPAQFRQIPEPPKVKNDKGELVLPEIDPRQPNYLLIELPGLIAAWECPFDITTTAGREKRKGSIYFLSNTALPLTAPPEQYADFSRTVMEQLAGALRVPTPDPTRAVPEEYPRARTYTQPNKFEVFRFGADQATIDDLPHTVEVYIHRQGEAQFMLVVVLPVGIDSTQKVSERVQMMLERLRVTAKRLPARKAPAVGGAAAPGAAPEATKPPPAF
jgi:hypothetical protein